MEKYLNKDADTLEEMLAACSDFKERRNIREALRELKGLKLDGDKIVTYSFGADTLKRLSSLKSPRKNHYHYSPPSTLGQHAELEYHAKFESNKNGYNVASPIEERIVENPSYSSYLNAGRNIRLQSDGKINSQSEDLQNTSLKEVDFNVPNERLRNNCDEIVTGRTIVRPDSLNLNGIKDASSVVRYNNQSKKIKGSQSSLFSPTSFLSPISKTVARYRTGTRTSENEVVPDDKKVNCDRKLDGFSEFKLRTEAETTMKTQDSRRNFSESSVPSPRNELSWADEVKKERSKSCNNENDYDIDGVRIRKKTGLSRKNRVEAEWNMSPRLSSKFRRKLGSSSDSISNVTSIASSNDPVINAIHTTEKSTSVNGEDSATVESKVTRKESAKKPPTHRKLPDIPVQAVNGDEDSDESVHENTLRLLQERRQLRRAKFKDEKQAELKQKSVTEQKQKSISEHAGTTDEKPRSKKKEIRLRRELQLLNRASESIITRTESHLSSKAHKTNGEEKHKTGHPVRRSKSDMVKSKPPLTPESAAQKVAEKNKEEAPVVVDVVGFDAMAAENKIDLIGSLMQEEAKLQETLRRTTSFSERRKIRSEVRQLREKRTALEGSPEAQPASVLQRSVSLSSGDVTPTAKTNGELTPLHDRKPSLEELRKQLSETSDYDEKRKIRLALRQLRQQSRESDDKQQGTNLKRSQSCFEIKSSQKSQTNDLNENTEKHVPFNEKTSDHGAEQVVAESLRDSKSKTHTGNTEVDKDIHSRIIPKDHSVIEAKPQPDNSDGKVSLNTLLPHAKQHDVTEHKILPNKQEREREPSKAKVKDTGSQLQSSVEINNKKTQDVLTNGPVEVNEKSDVKRHSSLTRDSKSIEDNKHSTHNHSRLHDSTSGHSSDGNKTQNSSSEIINLTDKGDSVPHHRKLPKTSGTKSVLERKKLSVGEEKIPKLQSVNSDKPYAKQRKHSLESLADSYRLRDQEDKKNRQFNSELLKNVIGKLEDKISKSPSKVLISRANSESCLSKRLKDLDPKSKDHSVKQLKDSKNLQKIQCKFDKNKEKHDIICKTVVNGLENKASLNESKSDVSTEKDKSVQLNTTEKETKNDRLSPSIPWLEDKIKSSPTPNELDKLMSTMDIEQAFSQILDAVEHFPTGTDTSEPPTPDGPINPIFEEEGSSASGLESANEEVDESRGIHKVELIHSNKEAQNESSVSEEIKMTPVNEKEVIDDPSDLTNSEVKDITNSDETAPDNSSAINSNSGIIKKSEAQIQLKSNLSLDLSPLPKENSAISVLHGEDGTVTVQEVHHVQEGDTVITERKKLHRTESKSEEYETDTVKETKVTSPRGSSSVYEKDVSKTKRKLTSRGSEYFTKSSFNLVRLKDNKKGTEIVEQALSSESENVSVSKNESWGSKSEAKVTLNKDSDNKEELKAIMPEIITEHIEDNAEPVKDNVDVFLNSAPSKSKCLAPLVHSSLSKTSSGYGSVSGSDEEEKDDIVETPLGRPSGCPVIASSMKEVTVSEGSTAILQCAVSSSPLPTVTWYKGTSILQESDRMMFHFDGVSGKASLKICNATSADLGEYKCFFNNPLGTAETKGRLLVKNKTSGPPSFVTQLDDITVSEGCSIVLECEVSGVDSVAWYKDGLIQRDSADFKQTFDGTKARLEIGEVFLDDDGTYTCAVKNSNAECRSSCKVSITESASDDTVAPAFLKKLESQIVDEQDLVIMECDIIGSPQPIITWYWEGKVLQEGDRFSSSYDGRVARLIMKRATKGDNGKYELVAQSSAGRISCDCLLVVKDLRTPPSISKPLSDLTVDDGKAATLECCIMGNPVPEIVWRKNRLIIGQMLDFKQTYLNNVAKLEIGKVCVQDSGCYECVATNHLGEVSSSCSLLVKDKPVSQSTSNTQSEEVILQNEEKTVVPGQSKTKVKNFPSGFTARLDDRQIKAAKSQASKIMLVRQSSLRSIDREKGNTGTSVKRSESLQMVRPRKKEDVPVMKTEEKARSNAEPDSEIKSENVTQSNIKINISIPKDTKESEKGTVSLELVSNDVELDSCVNHSKTNTDKDSVEESVEKPKLNSSSEEKVPLSDSVPKYHSEKAVVTSVSSIKLNDTSKKVDKTSIVDTDRVSILLETKNSDITKSEVKKSGDVMGALELDHNENIKIEQKPVSLLVENEDNVKNKATANDNDISGIATKDIATPKDLLVNKVSNKDTEKMGISAMRNAKDSALSKFEKLCSDAEKREEKPRFKSSAEIRRTQSVRTPGSEKPEWLQMKLRRVGEGKSPATEKKISPLVKDVVPQNDLEKPTSVPNDIKLNRSQSVKTSDRKFNAPLNDSTNTPIKDRNNDNSKSTPVSERAKMFQMNKDSSPLIDRKNPSAIIGKAINHLTRAESMRAPVGHKSFVVQRSQSFKKEEPSSTSGHGVTLDLSPPKTEGQEKSGELGVAKKPVKFWDPTTAPTTNMSYATMTDEEELHRLLAASDNFEERKKIRARIKELREIQQKEWEEKRRQHGGSEDLLKKRQREADLEKQKKLEAYKVQAAQPHEQKHLDVREQRIKEKMREAEEQKQKALETYDRIARKEDVTQKSTVHTEMKDGKTVTVRKVDSVSKTAGVGGMSYGKPAEEEAETLVKQLINSSSPAVSGVLSVKTESWSSKDGITHKSEKTESWGAKKPASAMNAFKQMDAKNNPQTNLSPGAGRGGGLARSPSAIKTMLLEWTKAMTREYVDKIEIQNFSTSWNDGLAFCALIHHFYPQSFDFNSLDAKNRRSNFELAFDTAEKYADIAPLLDVEDMVKMKKPDWKCVFTYVQSFYRKLKDHENNRVKSD